jgi:hypothetical protein
MLFARVAGIRVGSSWVLTHAVDGCHNGGQDVVALDSASVLDPQPLVEREQRRRIGKASSIDDVGDRHPLVARLDGP